MIFKLVAIFKSVSLREKCIKVSLRIQTECRKICTGKTLTTDTFQTVYLT